MAWLAHALFLFALLCLSGCAQMHPLMIVDAPVVDLRAQPHTRAQAAVQDPLQETQLLYGEHVRVIDERDGWMLIEAVEQAEYTHHERWQGYPGWVPAEVLRPIESVFPPTLVITVPWVEAWGHPMLKQPTGYRLPMGARLTGGNIGRELWRIELIDGQTVWIPFSAARALSEVRALPAEAKRRVIVEHAAQLVGGRYFWGGRSPYVPTDTRVTGVDCSGLINLVYRTVGIDVPRDSHEQFLQAQPVAQLLPGDVVFLSKPNDPRRIVHVMLYAGNGDVIEGPGTGLAVRRISLQERLEMPKASILPGARFKEQTIWFGSFLP